MAKSSSKKPDMQELLDKFVFLLEKYSLEPRANTQPFTLEKVRKQFSKYQYKPEESLIREPLLEHVGSLPVMATAMFPYINDPEVDLGEALTMLAVHDIGELVMHDEITFTKKKSQADDQEQAEALNLLDPMYHELYKDVESKGSQTAKFAKSIDKITPDIFDFITPADITKVRLKHFVGVEPDEIVDLIVKHKRPYMLWNPFLTEFHIFLMEKLAEKLSAD